MTPEYFVEPIEALLQIGFGQCHHLFEQIWMATDRALTENNQIEGQNIRAFDRNTDRNGSTQVAEIVQRSIHHRLAPMYIHRVVDGTAHAFRRLRLHDGRDDRRVMTLIKGGAGKAARCIEQVGCSGDTAERFFDAFERADRDIELLAHARVSSGRARGQACPAADQAGSEIPRPAARALISIFQPCPSLSGPPMTASNGTKTSRPQVGPFSKT